MCPVQSQTPQSQSGKNVPPPPPPRWAKPPFSNSSNEIQCLSPLGVLANKSGSANITVTTTVTFSVNNQTSHQLNDEDSTSQCGNHSVKSDSCINKIHSNNFDGSSTNTCQVIIYYIVPHIYIISLFTNELIINQCADIMIKFLLKRMYIYM